MANAIERLGGTAQIFAQMNSGPAEPNEDPYALVGRVGMDGSAAESSRWLTRGEGDGNLHGLLARGRDDQYQPLIAAPGDSVNAELVELANRPSPPGGGFPQYTRRQGGRSRLPRTRS